MTVAMIDAEVVDDNDGLMIVMNMMMAIMRMIKKIMVILMMVMGVMIMIMRMMTVMVILMKEFAEGRSLYTRQLLFYLIPYPYP